MGKRCEGFTLAEVMVALLILAVTVVPLLIQKGDVIRQTDETRQRRLAWVLLSRKMAELELQEDLFQQDASGSSGRFEEYDEIYSDFSWEYATERETVTIPDASGGEEIEKQICRLTVTVTWPGYGEGGGQAVLSGYFPVPEDVP